MERRGQPTAGVAIRASVPVNLRPLDRAHELGNAFGLVFLTLPIGIADPARRLRAIKKEMDGLKQSPEALVAFGVLSLMGLAPVEIEQAGLRFFGSKATAVLTNVPGPRQPLYLAGRKIGKVMFWVPQSGHLGIGISIISYEGGVMLGIATDARPEPARRRRRSSTARSSSSTSWAQTRCRTSPSHAPAPPGWNRSRLATPTACASGSSWSPSATRWGSAAPSPRGSSAG